MFIRACSVVEFQVLVGKISRLIFKLWFRKKFFRFITVFTNFLVMIRLLGCVPKWNLIQNKQQLEIKPHKTCTRLPRIELKLCFKGAIFWPAPCGPCFNLLQNRVALCDFSGKNFFSSKHILVLNKKQKSVCHSYSVSESCF